MTDRRPAATFLRAVVAPAPALAATAFTAGLVAGVAEAVALTLLVRAAVAVAGGEAGADIALGPLGVDLSRGAALAWAAAATAVRLAAASVLASTVARLTANMVDGRRRDLISAFLGAPWPVQATEVEGELQELLVGHLARVEQAASVVATGLGSGGTFVALTAAAVVLAPGPALVLLIGLGLVVAVALPGLQRVAMSSGDQAAADLGVAGASAEIARLAAEVRVYGVEREVETRINRRISASAEAQQQRIRAGQMLPAVSYAVVIGTTILALAVTSALDDLDLAATGGAVLIVIRALVATQPLQESWSQARAGAPFLATVTERIAYFRRGRPDAGTLPLDRIERLDLRAATYTYPNGHPGLRSVDLTVQRGEVLGIAGSSGGGKSTLAQVLLGLRAVDGGQFLVNGRPGAEVDPRDWSRLVAFVPQDPLVFDGTVAENIDFFRELPPGAVEEAARRAGLSAEDLPLDRVVGPGRGTLSGGQRQRVVVARALAGSPDLLVLDEPTSALDATTEATILEMVGDLRAVLTLVIVSHRPAPLAVCDRVVHMADGTTTT